MKQEQKRPASEHVPGWPMPPENVGMSGAFEEESLPEDELAATPILGQPETSFDMVNKYGTYNIQPTNDSGNCFPAIAQGLSRAEKEAHAKAAWEFGDPYAPADIAAAEQAAADANRELSAGEYLEDPEAGNEYH